MNTYSNKTIFTLDNCLKEYPELLTTKQVQTILHIGRNSTFKLLHSGSIRTIRVGHLLYTPKSVILDFLNGINTESLDLSSEKCYDAVGEQRKEEDVANG